MGLAVLVAAALGHLLASTVARPIAALSQAGAGAPAGGRRSAAAGARPLRPGAQGEVQI
jgi:hypothetical protein